MDDLQGWKIKIVGDGTQNPPYKWTLHRLIRGGFQANFTAQGSAESKDQCIDDAREKAEAILIRERSEGTVEEIEFNINLDPQYTEGGWLDEIPVAEPDRKLNDGGING